MSEVPQQCTAGRVKLGADGGNVLVAFKDIPLAFRIDT